MKKILTCPNCGYSFDATGLKHIINIDCPDCRKVSQTDFILKIVPIKRVLNFMGEKYELK
jgi:Zn-finger nucleic acid-binding protein